MQRRDLIAGLAGLPFMAAAMAVGAPPAEAAVDVSGQQHNPVADGRHQLFDMEAWDRNGYDDSTKMIAEHGFRNYDGVIGIDANHLYGPATVVTLSTMESGAILMNSSGFLSRSSRGWASPEVGPLYRKWSKVSRRRGLSYLTPSSSSALIVQDGPVPNNIAAEVAMITTTWGKLSETAYQAPIGVDNMFYLSGQMKSIGLDVREFPFRSHVLGPAVEDLVQMVRDGKLIHHNDPMIRWMMSNASALRTASGHVLPSRGSIGDEHSLSAVYALVLANAVRMGLSPRAEA